MKVCRCESCKGGERRECRRWRQAGGSRRRDGRSVGLEHVEPVRLAPGALQLNWCTRDWRGGGGAGGAWWWWRRLGVLSDRIAGSEQRRESRRRRPLVWRSVGRARHAKWSASNSKRRRGRRKRRRRRRRRRLETPV